MQGAIEVTYPSSEVLSSQLMFMLAQFFSIGYSYVGELFSDTPKGQMRAAMLRLVHDCTDLSRIASPLTCLGRRRRYTGGS